MFLSPFRIARSTRCLSTSAPILAGHNKWSKIEKKKGVNDAHKSATITRACRDIIVAVRTGGGSVDPEKNVTLATTLRRLKDLDIPKSNIERTLASAHKSDIKTGESVMYEAMAFNSIGIVIECMTDSPTRTIQMIRATLNKHSSRMTPVAFMFQRQGLVKIGLGTDPAESTKEALMDIALDNGALDFEESISEEGVHEVELFCEPAALSPLTKAVTSAEEKCELISSELIYSPNEKVEDLSDELLSDMQQLLAVLESIEDVSRVWTTLDR